MGAFIVKAFKTNDGTGAPFAVGSVAATVVANSAENVPVAMHGIPSTISIATNPSSVLSDSIGGTITAFVTVLDNEGGSPSSPSSYEDANGDPLSVAIGTSDASGSITISPSSFNAASPTPNSADQSSFSETPIMIHYNGNPIGTVTISATVGDLPTANATLTTVAPPSGLQHTIYVASHDASSDEIDEYSSSAFGSATPMRTLTGSLSRADGLATDTSGNLYVANERTSAGNDAILIFPAGASGNASPAQSITGSSTDLSFPIGLALDSSRNVYVLNAGASAGSQFVTVYSPGLNGNVGATNSISGPQTMLGGASSISVDPSGAVNIANNSLNNAEGVILQYSAGQFGNVTPAATIMTAERLVSIVQNSNSTVYGGFDDGIVSLAVSSGTTNYCVKIPSSSGAQGGPVAVDSAGQVFAVNALTDQVRLFPPALASTMCPELFPYRVFSLPSSRTVDAIAVGP